MNALSLFNDWLNNDYYGTSGCYGNSVSTPDVDVTENKDSYILDMDLPGRTENDVNLELNEGVLTIASSSEKNETKQIEDKSEEKKENEKPQFLLRERRRTSFRRSFTLPKDIDAEGVTAGFKNGVLTVRIPRKPESAPRKIQINIA
ncbi:Hsp20/alpha crystallin family protein [Treponema sp.]|uniref:Hsp20/alpha crystallin family protein n=1 Tax=Treponema sp. TaxID=166 RepID=UPI00389063EB